MGINIANRGSNTPRGTSGANLLPGAGLDIPEGGGRDDTRNGCVHHKHEEGFVAIAGTMGLTRSGRVLNALAYMQAAASARPPHPRDDSLAEGAHSRALAILALPATWWRRAYFRAQLRDLIAGDACHLRDVGFDEHDARAETARFFWQPVKMKQLC